MNGRERGPLAGSSSSKLEFQYRCNKACNYRLISFPLYGQIEAGRIFIGGEVLIQEGLAYYLGHAAISTALLVFK